MRRWFILGLNALTLIAAADVYAQAESAAGAKPKTGAPGTKADAKAAKPKTGSAPGGASAGAAGEAKPGATKPAGAPAGKPAAPKENEWAIDAAHSAARFEVDHLMVSSVEGSFSDIKGTVLWDEQDPKKSKVKASIAVQSINTGNKDRDEHLRSPDFFDAKKYPEMKFVSTQIKKESDGSYKVNGKLTIRNVTKPVTLDVVAPKAPVKHPMMPAWVRGVKARTTIDRKEFGIRWNKSMDSGGVVLGEKISIRLDLELTKPLPADAAAAVPPQPPAAPTTKDPVKAPPKAPAAKEPKPAAAKTPAAK